VNTYNSTIVKAMPKFFTYHATVRANGLSEYTFVIRARSIEEATVIAGRRRTQDFAENSEVIRVEKV